MRKATNTLACNNYGLLFRLFCLLCLLFASGVASTQTKVSGNKLLDPCGNQVIVRGVEQVVSASNVPMINEIAKTGANAVRLLPMFTSDPGANTAATFDALLAACKANGMVAMISPILSWEPASDELAWSWYERTDIYNVLMKYKDHTILDGVMEQNYSDRTRWETTAKTAIDKLRAKGYTQTINCMSSDYGRSAATIIEKSAAVFNHDPLKNVMFNVQSYWSTCESGWCATDSQFGHQGTSTEIIKANLAKLANLPYVVNIGTTPWAEGAGCNSGFVDYQTAMQECQRLGLGYLNWDWHNPHEWSHVFAMTTSNSGGTFGSWVNLCANNNNTVDCRRNTPYGCEYGYNVAIGNSASIQKTSVKTDFYKNSVCTSGNIVRELWTGIFGNAVSAIPVATTPASTSSITSLEGPANSGDNYGARIRAFVTPATTGSYTFYIAGDDNAELWLSTDDSPANKTLIASVTGWTNSREWTKYAAQKSTTRSLNAGTKYYIEILHKEGNGGDNLAVGWTGLNIPTITVVSGSVLSPYTSQPTTVGFSGTYKLTARHSDKALDVTSGSTADGANVQQWPDNGNTSQQWIVTPTTDGYYKLISKVSNKALEVANSSLSDGGNVQQWSYTGANNQQWKIEATTDGFYKLTNRNSGKVLDVSANATTDGQNVHQWTYLNGTNQQWKLTQLSTSAARLAASGVANEVNVYPNPATNGRLNLSLSATTKGKGEITLTNSLGAKVFGRAISVEEGENNLEISTEGLPTGLYLITIDQGKTRVVKKIIFN